jgi:peptide/nickel transport system ATP-binding protein
MAALFEVKDLKIEARDEKGNPIPIVKGVSFDIQPGEVCALIGESGSGKTTIALATLAYTKPGLEFCGGEVLLRGKNILAMEPVQWRELRGKNVAYLAQSAAATFNPAITIGEQVTESAVLHGVLSQQEATRRAEDLYRALELPDPDRLGKRYPHQVSGGAAAAFDGGHGAGGQAGPAGSRRTDHGPGRHHADRGAQSLQESHQGRGLGGHLRHP